MWLTIAKKLLPGSANLAPWPRPLAYAWILFHVAVGTVVAAAPPPPMPGQPVTPLTPKRYVYQYLLVALCIAAGLILVCQPRNREESVDSRMDLAYKE